MLPQTVYIPSYDPWMVYGYSIVPWPGWVEVPGIWWNGPGLYFGLGFFSGHFGIWLGLAHVGDQLVQSRDFL